MTIVRRFTEGTVTTTSGADTITTALGVLQGVGTAADLHDLATRGFEVQAGPDGFVIAQLRVEGPWFEMVRRDAADAVSRHHLDVGSTDAERLAQHWSGFVQAALHDHDLRLGRYRTRA